ncbi:hypothetical protein H4R24_003282 [Coemansia sp. RSA 988]|nr:hypothetical protein H4R24_003282 [Coemansia sp. RSA 988]
MPQCSKGSGRLRSRSTAKERRNIIQGALTQSSYKSRSSTRQRSVGRVLNTRRWLDKLPIDIFDLIFRHVSGTAAVDNYLRQTAWHMSELSLGDLWQLLLGRNAEMIQVCSGWRKLLAPTFYQYCVYDCKIDAPLVPEEQFCHIRKLLVYIPEEYCSYRNVVRGIFRLPIDVRKRINWLGVCMNKSATISMSEMGALAEAFPNLRHVWADLASLNTKLCDVYPVLIGTATPVQITAFVARNWCSINQKIFVAFVRRAAASLEYLDLDGFPMCDAYRVIWGSKTHRIGDLPRFPRLRTLRIVFNYLNDTVVAESSQGCPFPMLEELTCHAETYYILESVFRVQQNLAKGLYGFVARLLAHCPPTLKYLNINDVNGTMLGQQASRLYSLKHIVLHHRMISEDNGITDGVYEHNNLSETLQLVKYIPMLRSLTIKAGWQMRQIFEPSALIHDNLRMLDISSSKLTICDMQQLLERFSNLEEIHLTLVNPEIYLPPNEIKYNMSLQRLWVNACMDDLPMWNGKSLDSLMTLLARMPKLKELLLFEKAVEWLSKAISRKNRDDLLWLSLGVNIGRCNYDEKVVRHTTTLFL